MRQHLAFVSIILFFVLMGIAGGAQAERHERTGISTMKQKSLPNALVAAHFECNKDRLWANLDTLEVVETSTSQYKISGGRKNITEYHTTVRFECATNYERYLPEDREEV
jgi:hypothetical protein